MAGNGIGRWLIVVGLALAVVGVLLILAEKWPGFGSLFGWIGKLPGDLSFKREQFSVYVPIATSLVLSILLSVVLYVLSWLFRR
ncbi:MAG: hypothetical protein OJF52_000129 [Nitrospira sp.]|jgi:membrane-bound ClpP family serine protease|nr:MAG: hypothetical protein OJF52_000129 [Nitrospira sp.]